MDIIHPDVSGTVVHKKSSGLRVRLPDEQPGGRTVTIPQVRVVLAAAAEDGGLAGGAGRQRRGDGVHRRVLVAGVSRAGR